MPKKRYRYDSYRLDVITFYVHFFLVKTPVNSPFWSILLQAVEDEVEEIHMTCDLLFPTTAKEVRHMLDKVKYHKIWVPTQASYNIIKYI